MSPLRESCRAAWFTSAALIGASVATLLHLGVDAVQRLRAELAVTVVDGLVTVVAVTS